MPRNFTPGRVTHMNTNVTRGSGEFVITATGMAPPN